MPATNVKSRLVMIKEYFEDGGAVKITTRDFAAFRKACSDQDLEMAEQLASSHFGLVKQQDGKFAPAS